MRDLSIARRPPLALAGAGVHALPPQRRYVLRGDEAVRQAAGEALGLAIPAAACRAAVGGERAALWLGPDEWLLLGPEAPAADFAAALAGRLEELAHSLVDVSHRQSALEVRGARATTLIAAGCPLDLDAAAFPVGMCTRTMLAKSEIVLWRTGEESFRIEVWRSFLAYVAQFLHEAARG